MARIILSALLTLILTLLSGCSDPQPPLNPTLLRADSLIETHADSALALLDTLDRTLFLPADSDLYALLLTQAAFKNDRPLRSDTLIRRARRAYRRHGQPTLRRHAAFYSALSYYRRGHLPSAMSDALNAYELAKSEPNPYWTAKSAELIADIFDAAYNYTEAIKYSQEAIEQYKLAGRVDNHRYAICDLATNYVNQGYYYEALAILDSLNNIITDENPIDSNLQHYLFAAQITPLIYTDNVDKAKDLIIQNDNFYHNLSNQELLQKELDYTRIDTTLESSSHLNNAISLSTDKKDLVLITYASYELAIKNEDYKKAALLCDSLLTLQSEIAAEILSESVVTVQRDYYVAESERFKVENLELHDRVILLFITATIIIISLLSIYLLNLRARRAELASSLKDIIALQNENSIISQNAAKLFRGKWQTLNTLCNAYFDLDKPEEKRTVLLNKIEHELNKIKKDKTIAELENAININLDGLMKQMREECDFLDEKDFKFLVLLFSGFSAQVVCILTDIKYKNFYLKKGRLKKKISESEAPHKADFIRHF